MPRPGILRNRSSPPWPSSDGRPCPEGSRPACARPSIRSRRPGSTSACCGTCPARAGAIGSVGIRGWPTPSAAGTISRQLPEHGIALLPQRGASLGERMHAVFVDLCHVGYRQVSPGWERHSPPSGQSSVRKACDFLRQGRSDVVLGPADDGGYYLIGLGRPEERLFSGIAWSTASVLEQTLARARELELRVGTVARHLRRRRGGGLGDGFFKTSNVRVRCATVGPGTHAWMHRRVCVQRSIPVGKGYRLRERLRPTQSAPPYETAPYENLLGRVVDGERDDGSPPGGNCPEPGCDLIPDRSLVRHVSQT